jgi:mRNA-degrading endonuclease RelE of RelBE toxin-antitoxin system
MRHEIRLSDAAVADMGRLRAFERAAVRVALDRHLRDAPERTRRSRIKRLRGLERPQYRQRLGDIRVPYDVRHGMVEVLAVIRTQSTEQWLREEGRP